jgi:murein DD-endopeptidase MepM/ murein hydrolase activator NlpD
MIGKRHPRTGWWIAAWSCLTILVVAAALTVVPFAHAQPPAGGLCAPAAYGGAAGDRGTTDRDCTVTARRVRAANKAANEPAASALQTPAPTVVASARAISDPTPVIVRVATATVVRVGTPTVVHVTKPTVVQVSSSDTRRGGPVSVKIRTVVVVRVPAPAPGPKSVGATQPGPGTTAGTTWNGQIISGDDLQETALPAGFALIWGGADVEISQEFGHTSFSQGNSMYAYGTDYGLDGNQHTGLDIGVSHGTPLFSPIAGVVVIAGGSGYYCNSDYGQCGPGAGELLIQLDDGHQLILGHMSVITVAEGQRVAPGDPVGASGSANGPHIHLETRLLREGRYLITDPRASFLLSIGAAQPVGDPSGVPAPPPAPGLMEGAAEGLASPPGPEWANVNRWDNEILAASRQAAVPANLIKAVMRLESDGDPNAKGADGVVGLMQIYTNVWGDGPWISDNAANILKGAKILRIFYDENGQDWGEALRHYHGIGFDGNTTDTEYRDIILGYLALLIELSS